MIAWLKLAVIWCCNEAIAFKVGTWKDEPVSSEEPAEDPESEVYVNASLNASTPAQKIVDAVDRCLAPPRGGRVRGHMCSTAGSSLKSKPRIPAKDGLL